MVSYRELTRFMWQFIRLQRWTFLLSFILDSFAWPLDVLVWPYILRQLVDIFALFEADRFAVWNALIPPVIGGLVLVLFVETASRTMGFLMGKALPILQTDIRMHMFDHIQHHSPRYFNDRFSGNFANKITDMTTQIELILQQLFFPIVPAIAACILGAVFLWFVNPLFIWLFLGWLIIHLSICILFTHSVDAFEHRHGEARSTLLGKIVDSFTNNFAVNLFYRFSYEKKLISRFQKIEQETNQEARFYVEKMRIVLSLLYIVGIFSLFGFIIRLWVFDQITTGQVVQVLTTMLNLSMILWTVGSSIPILFQSFGIAKQAYSVMQDSEDLGDIPKAKELKITSGEIVFANVSFRYGDQNLFVNKHAHIRGGEKVGLVGYTGAGKSTFITLILRLFPLLEGKILIDGQDISCLSLASLRRQITLIPQDPVLFHRTLRENICYGNPDATEEDMLQAAMLAHCDEFIRHLPNGYETKVGERGTKLSGGERQRIAIARAILVNAPILILDEATSALDSVTEKYIQGSLGEIMRNRTTIVVAHRLSTISRMDRILVFDKGKIVEEGTHVNLLSKNGLYAKMWDMQVGGFLPNVPV